MLAIWSVLSVGAMALEGNGNPNLTELSISRSAPSSPAEATSRAEVRFGTGASGLWAVSTTGTSNGSVNSMHDSMTPLGGASP